MAIISFGAKMRRISAERAAERAHYASKGVYGEWEWGFDGLLILRQRQSLSRFGARPKTSNLIYQNCKICLTL
jgi:hypothetical protein